VNIFYLDYNYIDYINYVDYNLYNYNLSKKYSLKIFIYIIKLHKIFSLYFNNILNKSIQHRRLKQYCNVAIFMIMWIIFVVRSGHIHALSLQINLSFTINTTFIEIFYDLS